MSKRAARAGVVAGVDGSVGCNTAVRWAAHAAAVRNDPLTLVHVLPPAAGAWLDSSLVPAWMRRQRERGQQALDEALAIAGNHLDPDRIRCEMPSAAIVPALAGLSRDADLVVVGRLGNGTLRGRHMGSVSSGLVYHAHCPVAVVPDDAPLDAGAERPVLVGVDGSRGSESALAFAFDEASRRGVGLTAMHAWSDVNVFDLVVSLPGPHWQDLKATEDKALAERLAGWGERYPDVPVSRLIARDEPAHQLVDGSESAQLVVVGSHGRGGFAGMLLGSVSAAVLLLAHVPVVVVRRPAA